VNKLERMMLAQLEEQTDKLAVSGQRPAWLNLAAHLDARFGGISAALPDFCNAVSKAGTVRADLAPFCSADEQYDVPSPVAIDRFPLGTRKWFIDRELRGRLQRSVAGAAGIHIHGLWQEHCLFGVRAARSAGKPYVISAHGMLDRWALGHKRLKKAVYAALVERRNLKEASCLHALTKAEAEDYRRFGSMAPIAVIPNGVTVPGDADMNLFLDSFPELRGKRVVLFLARLHFKKGLDILSRAWARSSRPNDVHLVLAGPDFDGTQAKLQRMLEELGICSSVTFAGMLKGGFKWSALAAADAFVLPSRSEGLSMSVLEALGMGIPAIVTNQCNVPEVKTNGCGWSIEPDEDQLAAALNQFFETSRSERLCMGARGRRTVESMYAWDAVGRQMSKLYEWILGGGLPSDVDLRL
jgi:glycosyltransferase involved in cell wall biosynthesis